MFFQKTPHPINDLGTPLRFDDATCYRVLALCHLDIARLSPLPFALHFDSLLAMTHIVMENSGFDLVGLCGVGKNDLSGACWQEGSTPAS